MKVNKYRVLLAIGGIVSTLVLMGSTVLLLVSPDAFSAASLVEPETETVKRISEVKYGFVLDSFQHKTDQLRPGESLSEILTAQGISFSQVVEMVDSTKATFDTRKMKIGREYLALADKYTGKLQFFIYDIDAYRYVVYDFTQGKPKAQMVERDVTVLHKTASGVVVTSLWDAMVESKLDWALAVEMEKALKNSVDFFHIRAGDKFKVLYTEKFIEGKSVGIGQLSAAYFNYKEEDYYAFFYKNELGGIEDFFDEKARPMKKAYLKAPVEFTRISSKYNLNRFHPVLKRVKPHLGTDYAAPHGTPIFAIADGVVEEATRRGGNGIFVKIKHDKVFTSQYLHMSKHASGMRPGVPVKQGQVIGYVGSTGLATGPHVCFRFWKNGQQVDFLKEKLPRPQPMTGIYVNDFFRHRDSLITVMESIPYNEKGGVATAVIKTEEKNTFNFVP